MTLSEVKKRFSPGLTLGLAALMIALSGVALWYLGRGEHLESAFLRESQKAQLVSRMRADLFSAAEAEKSAVLAETDEASQANAKRARATTDQVASSLAELKGLLMQNYALPAGMAPGSVGTPPEVRFRIGEDGTLSEIKLVKSSGNSFADDACVSAAQQTRKVSAPPPKYRNHGIGVECDK